MEFSDYAKYTDEEILDLVRTGDTLAQDYILEKYKALVKIKARAYFLIGADKEDIIQEGMIGLYKAIRDYQKNRQASFKSFADLCINRQMITAVKTATRQKHQPLNSYVSLNKNAFGDESESSYIDTIKSKSLTNPEAMLIGQEDKIFIEEYIGEALSAFEFRVLSLYVQGKSYQEIAHTIDKPEKSVDNALQRVKKKTEKFLAKKT